MYSAGKVLDVIQNRNHQVILLEVSKVVSKHLVIGIEETLSVKKGSMWWFKMEKEKFSLVREAI